MTKSGEFFGGFKQESPGAMVLLSECFMYMFFTYKHKYKHKYIYISIQALYIMYIY